MVARGSILGRRSVLRAGAGFAMGMAVLTDRASGETAALNMQLGWLGGGNQLGEACAHQLGYFQEEGLDFHIQPGGPNNDGIAIVASGRYEVRGRLLHLVVTRWCETKDACRTSDDPSAVDQPFKPVSADVFMSNSERWQRQK